MPPSPPQNHLLTALPPEVLARLIPSMQPFSLQLKQTLYPSGAEPDAVYFIEKGLVSLLLALDDGFHAEVGLIGPEGMAGLPLIVGEPSFAEAMVQGTGHALRMDGSAFRRAFDGEPTFRNLILRYNEAMCDQAMQTAACNGRHQLEQRLARWLLMTLDRSGTDDLELTHEFLSLMLCVHRPGITAAIGILQRAQMIRTGRGHVKVLDRQALEDTACDCYANVKRRFHLLLGP
jgi:CRP-like cAMP-binding protein